MQNTENRALQPQLHTLSERSSKLRQGQLCSTFHILYLRRVISTHAAIVIRAQPQQRPPGIRILAGSIVVSHFPDHAVDSDQQQPRDTAGAKHDEHDSPRRYPTMPGIPHRLRAVGARPPLPTLASTEHTDAVAAAVVEVVAEVGGVHGVGEAEAAAAGRAHGHQITQRRQPGRREI
jgi:hypothetical protein